MFGRPKPTVTTSAPAKPVRTAPAYPEQLSWFGIALAAVGIVLALVGNHAQNHQQLAEGLALAERAGLDPKLVVEAIATSQAASPQVGRNTQRMIAGDFARDIVCTPVLRLKDVDYALLLADSLGVATPFGDAAREAFARLVALGARDDHEARVIEVARKRKGE